MDQDKNKRKKLYSAFVLTFIMFLLMTSGVFAATSKKSQAPDIITPGTVLL